MWRKREMKLIADAIVGICDNAGDEGFVAEVDNCKATALLFLSDELL